MPDDNQGDSPNFVKEALKWQYNWIGLAGAVAFAVVSSSGLPLILAAGLELIYLAVVPQSGRFRNLVRGWRLLDEKRKQDRQVYAMFQDLPQPLKDRYAAVFRVTQEIRANYDRLSSTSQIFVGQMEDRFQGLLIAYIRLLHSAFQQREYLRTFEADSIRRDVAQLERSLDKEVPKVQEINRKRVEILNKRLEKFNKIHENSQVVEAQCSAMEDVLGLVRDQSLTMRDPQELTNRLDSLVQDVEQTETSVREVEALFDLTTQDPLALPDMPASEVRPLARNRVKE